MKRIKIIHNPVSGRQTNEAKLEKLSIMLLNDGHTISKFITHKKDDAKNEAIKSSSEEWDLIISSGGDGTLNEVASGLVEGGNKIPVAILGSGTTNDFANSLELPQTTNDFYNMINNFNTYDVDLGLYNNKVFVNVAAGGFLTNVAHQVSWENKNRLGKLAYYLEGIKELSINRDASSPMTVISNGRVTEEDAMIFIISNSASVGGFKRFSPKADVSDGLLDVVLIKESDIGELIDLFIKLLNGYHVLHDNVIYFKSSFIKMESEKKVIVDVDGEFGGTLPGEFSVLPGALKILI